VTRVTTHVLDTTTGRPARGLSVRLERVGESSASALAEATTGEDGRVADWLPAGVPPGRYRLVFATGPWLEAAGLPAFFPVVSVELELADAEEHCHVPLLLAPFADSTYRGGRA
jgi:5-hydroxyisourate hydrolase